jgi:LacI family transcriptional regulator
MDKMNSSGQKGKVSLKTIAKELNTSVATVSWVLSGKGDEKKISSATQKSIIAYARQKNYQPNMLARALNVGISSTVGLILPSISDSFYSGVSKAIESSLGKRNYSLMICSSESYGVRENNMINMLKSYQVAGIIIAPTKISIVEIKRLIDESYPLVLFDRYFTDLPISHVLIDNEESSFKLVDHIITKGAKRIAFITTNPHLTTLNYRLEGYMRALRKHHIPVNPDLIGVVPFHGYENKAPLILDQIFSKFPDVDGFFFSTHILAIEAFKYFISNGIDYNNRFKLACIHEEPLFPIISPNINVALMPVLQIGESVVDILLHQIEEKISKVRTETHGKVEEMIIPCKHIYRD